jgi:hypothetical protein
MLEQFDNRAWHRHALPVDHDPGDNTGRVSGLRLFGPRPRGRSFCCGNGHR